MNSHPSITAGLGPARRGPRAPGFLWRRFAGAFALIVALLLAVAGTSSWLMSAIAAHMRGIVEIHNAQVGLANQMISSVATMGSTLRTLTLLTDLKEIDREARLLGDATAQYMENESQLAAAMDASQATAAEIGLLDGIRTFRARTLPPMRQVSDLAVQGSSIEAIQILMKDVRPVELQWQQGVAELVALKTGMTAAAYEEALAVERRARQVLAAVSLVSVLLSAFFAWRLTQSVVRPASAAIHISRRIAEGDLTTPVPGHGTDELGRLIGAMAAMQQHLRGLVGGIRLSSERIAHASQDIAAGNGDLRDRTDLQAASLQKSAAGMDQLAVAVRQNALAAQTADELAAAASRVALEGGDLVTRVMGTMEGISAGAQRVAAITSVMDSIAFQTHILALNAAIEAARAGTHGRGFAVVAGEVQTLARRSAEASGQIRALIEASVRDVQGGSELVAATGTTMQEIVRSTRQVADLMGEITSSTAQQSASLGHMSDEIHRIDRVTQQNAALVELSAHSAASLRDEAERLSAAVAAFSISPAGSARLPGLH